MNNKIISTLIISIFLISFISAQDIITNEDLEQAGILPDSGLYQFKLFFQRFSELFSESAKLVHARQRLAEAKVMIYKNKLQLAQGSLNAFNRVRERVKDKSMIQEHKELVDNLGQKISQIANQQGKLSEEQKLEIQNMIQEHKERIKNESIEIQLRTMNFATEQDRNQFRERVEEVKDEIDNVEEDIDDIINGRFINKNGNS